MTTVPVKKTGYRTPKRKGELRSNSKAKERSDVPPRRSVTDFPKQERRTLADRSIGDTVQLLVEVKGYKDNILGFNDKDVMIVKTETFPLAIPGDYGSYQGQEELPGMGEVCVIKLKRGTVKLKDDGLSFKWTD